ncbi:MAG: glycoside hydrolase family 172 protein [Planctomycetota bacterium]
MSFPRLLGAAACCVGFAAAQAPTLDYPALLSRLTDANWLWQPPVPGEKCVQWSSYDRASHKGPADHGAWYANNDRGQHLRVEEKGGTKEFVMVDAKGPGCVARIWSANPSGTLHFDVDGARVWSVDFAALCSGKVEGVPEPLAGMRSRGGNCYLPIPFAKSLVVACTAGDCYYAFDVVQFATGRGVTPFQPRVLQEQAGAVQRLCSAFPCAQPPFATQLLMPARQRLVPPASLVRELRIGLPLDLKPTERLEVLQQSLLVVQCGDDETVRVPLADFFAAGSTWLPHGGRFLAIAGTTAWCAFPMPMPRGGRIEIVGEPDHGEIGPQILAVVTEPLHEREPLLFRASYHVVKGTKTRPFSDHLVLDARGVGRFVGCSLLIRNPSRVWWGEGDEKFTVDGGAFPSWFGTGTEDYFGYAWCDPTPFQSPFHAQVECQGPMNFGITQLHRTHLLDSVPFQQSFRFELERWHWVEDIAMDYATVAYWYGAAGATSGLPPVPPAAERAIERPASPPVFVAEGALEGEELRIVACPSGTHEVQDMWFVENTFSKDRQVWWRDGKVGDAFVLAVPVPAAGKYKVTAAFCQADDYGTFQVALGGQALGAPIDLFAERVRSSGPRDLGIVELPAGDAELRFQLTGRNEKAKPRFMLGFDYVRLQRQP